VFARCELAAEREPGILLEGSWSGEPSPERSSIDDLIAGRFGWIDDAAVRLAVELGARDAGRFAGPGPAAGVTFAWINSLGLRYHLVKLLRVAAALDEAWAADPPRAIELHAARGRDEDYADLLAELCRKHSVPMTAAWRESSARDRPLAAAGSWRRMAAAAARPWMMRGKGRTPRVLFAGNPALLEPLARELARRGAAIGWLRDRFAPRSWLRWSVRGGSQFVCDAHRGRESRFAQPEAIGPLPHDGLDLGPAVARWLSRQHTKAGAAQSRLLARIDQALQRFQPQVIVLDEDATPQARAVVAVARGVGVPSTVVQHGAPYVRMSFAPLAADCLLAWGETSQERFVEWGIPRQRIRVTGCPKHDAGVRRPCNRPGTAQGVRRTILFLATNPPADDRPDAVALNMTSAAHRRIVGAAFAAVARLPNVELVVRLHPRCRDRRVFDDLLAPWTNLPVRVVYGGSSLGNNLARAACILSCGSTAGIEAAATGVPVIEILTHATAELLPAAAWGYFGVARTGHQVERLLAAALESGTGSARIDERIFGPLHRTAAALAADAVVDLACGPRPSAGREWGAA
jgi:hypothetical protein